MQLTPRSCPICGASSNTVFCDSNIDTAKLDRFAFASRKDPELMRHRLVRCETCDLVYADPAPSLEFLHDEYEKSSFDSSEEAACAARTYRKYLPSIALSGKALDIGSGGGEFLGELLRLGFTWVEGIEPSPAAIATARPEVRPRLRQGLFIPELHTLNSYSLISCFQTIEHVTDPLSLSRAAYLLLENGGVYYTVSHNIHGTVNRLLGTKSPIFDIEHLQLFSPRSMESLLKKAGFTDITIFPIWNSYPLHYWVKLLPLPATLKYRIRRLLKTLRIGDIPVSLPVGNMAAIAIK